MLPQITHIHMQKLAQEWSFSPSQPDKSLEIVVDSKELDTNNHWGFWLCCWSQPGDASDLLCYHVRKSAPKLNQLRENWESSVGKQSPASIICIRESIMHEI